MRPRRKGFTLIELLVVISIIALLLAVVLPSLNKAKQKAKEVVCKSNTHQWSVVALMYTSDNNDRFWVEYTPGSGKPVGQWMSVLSPYYGDVDKFRLCPSAGKPNPDPGAAGIGTANAYWGGEGNGGPLMQLHGFSRGDESLNKNYSSYGINLWINDVKPPTHVGWRGRPEWQWRTPLQSRAYEIPMIMDCTWYGANPDNPTVDPTEQPAAVTTSSYWSQQTYTTVDWNNDIARLLIDRHSNGINICFMDGSAQKTKLEDLWSWKWHKAFDQKSGRIELPWRSQPRQ
jgi:prepilin-type N-terminal cleavage/methylation domain-containing protein/prepilin-type processing-associated H-X9-DG protein